MSLFPAFATEQPAEQVIPPELPPGESEWLENKSFAVEVSQLQQDALPGVVDISSSDSDWSSSSPVTQETEEPASKRVKKRKKEKNKAKEPPPKPQLHLEFHDEEFYVDKAPVRMYKTIQTLHKPACPRYRINYRRKMGAIRFWREGDGKLGKTYKRYYRHKLERMDSAGNAQSPLDENDYTLKMGQLNRKTMEAPGELEPWLELAQLQDRNPYRWSRLMLAEKKLDYVQRALVYHPRTEALYRTYIETINATYPSYEVSKMLDRLLSKDAHNYTLWTAQIMATQGYMARCVVPDVLRIYERCMQKMHNTQAPQKIGPPTANEKPVHSDDVMLKLFNNCALFLRQAGLYEQFFALVKLALELNVSTDQFGDFAPQESEQRTLIEYEELILQSGLPMNEIWLRIEKLRQGFNFLPCPANVSCADPQRIVFNEDVCHYIYPMKRRDNSFYLMLLILRLMKLPFVHCDGLAGKFCARVEDIGDSDAIEDMLAVCVRHAYALPQQHNDFQTSLYELAKEMTVSPTYLSNSIGHEIYTRCLNELLLNCAAAHAGTDERKRIIFVLLWCRFQRLLLVLQRLAGKLTPEYVKAGRGRFKALLKLPANRSVLNFYTEFALYEFEALAPTDALDTVQSTFDNIIAAHATAAAQTHSAADVCSTFLAYAEILLGRGLREQALHVIVAYALDGDIKKSSGTIGAAKKLLALQRLTEKLENLVSVERNVEIMVLEQYLLPDYTVSVLRLRTLLQCLVEQKTEALVCLDKLLQSFRRADSDRHAYLRENILELYVLVLQLPCPSCAVSNGVISTKLFAALDEFPRNLFLLQRCAMLSAAPWYKIRSSLLRASPSIAAVTFLIAAARYRFVQSLAQPDGAAVTGQSMLASDYMHHEAIVRNRILSLFRALSPSVAEGSAGRLTAAQKALHRNALFWRFYLRCLSDQTTAFDTSKKCLLTALDECPWNKALYLDGATYVPQELTHLQDLLIEKQMRIYALPEELEILRER